MRARVALVGNCLRREEKCAAWRGRHLPVGILREYLHDGGDGRPAQRAATRGGWAVPKAGGAGGADAGVAALQQHGIGRVRHADEAESVVREWEGLLLRRGFVDGRG